MEQQSYLYNAFISFKLLTIKRYLKIVYQLNGSNGV